MAKKIIIGQSEWTIKDSDAEEIARALRDALTKGAMVELPLADAQGRAVSVFVNGATVPSLVLDMDEGPRPSEMS